MNFFEYLRGTAGRINCLALLALLLVGCGKMPEQAITPRPVVAMPVKVDTQSHRWSLPGHLEAREVTSLSFRVGGKIVERQVRLGDTVRPGQILARLDPADARKNAASAQAQLVAARHDLQYAQRQLDRDRNQAREQLISKRALEQTRNAHAAALAQRDQAAQRAALANDQLAYTTLSADHAGVITQELADTGQNVTAGQAVYRLAWSGAMDAWVDVPETLLAELTLGQHATVTLPALPGETFNATLRELAPAADPQSRTYRAKLTMDGLTPVLRLGMTASVTFDVAQVAPAKVYSLPTTALFHDGKEPAVWVVQAPDETLMLRRVTVGRYDARTVVVTDGLAEGERVVWQGVHTVSAGEKVRPVPPLHPEAIAP